MFSKFLFIVFIATTLASCSDNSTPEFDVSFFTSEFKGGIEQESGDMNVDIEQGKDRLKNFKITKSENYIEIRSKDGETQYVHETTNAQCIGKHNDTYIAYSVNSYGGTGNFSAIQLYWIKDGKIQYKTIHSGDRGFDGIIATPSFVNGKLYFKAYLDPDSFCKKILNVESNIKGNAIGEFGICNYLYDLDNDKLELTSVEINTDDNSVINEKIHPYIKNIKYTQENNQITLDKKEAIQSYANFLAGKV